MATPYSNEISLEELNKRKKKKRPGQPIADIMANQQMTAGYPGRAGSTATSSKFGEQVKGGPKPKRKSLAPKKSLIPKPKLKKKPFQMLSAREAAELKQSGVKYEGIPEGSVPATVMPSPKPGEGMSARDRAEMGMKKGRKVKKMMGGGMMKKKGYKNGGKINKMDIPVVKAGKGPMKRKLTAAEEARELRSRLRGTTGGGKPDVTPAMKGGGMLKKKKKGFAKGGMAKKGYAKGGMAKKGYAMGGMMKKKGMAKGGKVRGSGIARQGVRAAKMM